MVASTASRGAVLWELLRAELDRWSAHGGPGQGRLTVLDAGGGTGGFAVPLAGLGHEVTVVDPSPDSLAALRRRAEDQGVAATVHGLQGDISTLPDLVPPASVDIVVCHSVLEVVEDPAAALRALVGVLRPGGLVSVLAAGRPAAVLSRAVAGRLAEALHVLRDPEGRDCDTPGAPRRFDRAVLVALVRQAGLEVTAVHGVRVVSELVGGAVLDRDQAARSLLAELERDAATRPELLDLAAQLHVLARRPPGLPAD